MDESEFRAQVAALPPGMRFMVSHVVQLSAGVVALFGGLLIAVLVVNAKGSSVIATFCVVAIVLAFVNMTVFTVAKRRMTRAGTDPEA
jgi:cation transporter-like permease